MNDNIWEELRAAGVEYTEGLNRLNGSEALYIKLLGKFTGDGNYADFLACMEAGDTAQAAIHLHALKGLAANLSMNALYKECIEAEKALRAGEPVKNMDSLRRSYDTLIDAIKRV